MKVLYSIYLLSLLAYTVAAIATSPCDVYRELSMNCTNEFPHITSLNSTHNLSCDIIPKQQGKCTMIRNKIKEQLNKNSWWHCEGSASQCIARMTSDLQRNMGQEECSGRLCITEQLPSFLVTLSDIAEQLGSINETEAVKGDNFTSRMQLLSNIVIQKSRFCRFDLQTYSKLLNLVSSQKQQQQQKSSNTVASEEGQDEEITTRILHGQPSLK